MSVKSPAQFLTAHQHKGEGPKPWAQIVPAHDQLSDEMHERIRWKKLLAAKPDEFEQYKVAHLVVRQPSLILWTTQPLHDIQQQLHMVDAQVAVHTHRPAVRG